MKQEVKDGSTSIAWFKLAQLVTSKEKEKALGLFRLLAHSFDDKAYALQLEGDLLWAFADEDAKMKYTQAAFLYKKEKRVVSAIAIYEHLLTLDPSNLEVLSTLIECYAILDWQERLQETFTLLLDRLKEGSIDEDNLFHVVRLVADQFHREKNEKSLKDFHTFIADKNAAFADKAAAFLKG